MNEGKLQLLEFLRGLSYKGQALLINPNRLLTLQQLQSAVLRGDRFLDEVDEEVRGCGGVPGVGVHMHRHRQRPPLQHRMPMGAIQRQEASGHCSSGQL